MFEAGDIAPGLGHWLQGPAPVFDPMRTDKQLPPQGDDQRDGYSNTTGANDHHRPCEPSHRPCAQTGYDLLRQIGPPSIAHGKQNDPDPVKPHPQPERFLDGPLIEVVTRFHRPHIGRPARGFDEVVCAMRFGFRLAAS